MGAAYGRAERISKSVVEDIRHALGLGAATGADLSLHFAMDDLINATRDHGYKHIKGPKRSRAQRLAVELASIVNSSTVNSTGE